MLASCDPTPEVLLKVCKDFDEAGLPVDVGV